MNSTTFKQKANELTNQFQSLINQMPHRGDSSKESQKIYLQMALNHLNQSISGVEDSDFDNEYGSITKKEFKERCHFTEYGRGANKQNAIFFDWQNNPDGYGYKYMVKASPYSFTKKELFESLYNWVVKEEQPHWLITTRYAMTDFQRFKVPVCG